MHYLLAVIVSQPSINLQFKGRGNIQNYSTQIYRSFLSNLLQTEGLPSMLGVYLAFQETIQQTLYS